MPEKSRTSKSIKNIIVATLFLVVNLVMQFFCRKVFLDYLGSEVLGLNTTATNLLQFLNLAELGIGAAVGFSLYKPIFEGDERTISEIIALQGHLYRRIALVVIAGAIVISFFFPLIFGKMNLPLWYAYASFGVLLLSALLSYFVNYKEILLSADQKEYKILYSYRACMLVRLLVQYFAVKYLDNPYIWWLVFEGGFSILASISLNRMISRTYPFLKDKSHEIQSGKELRKKYPEITLKIKQVFFHKISTYVLQQTSPLIIYAFTTLTLVAYYGNYMLVVTGVAMLLNALFNSINAGVGNLIAEGDRKKILGVFSELFAARFFLSAGASMLVFMLTPSFISIWIGPGYLLPESTLILITVTMFINASRSSVDSFISGYGMFQDIWAPITEALLNLGLSVLFGFFWGLDGILLGVLTSLLLIVFIWKPYFLFRKGIKAPMTTYIRIYACNLAAFILAAGIEYTFLKFISIESDAVGGFILYGLTVFISFAIFFYLTMSLCTKGMRSFTLRMIQTFAKRHTI